MIVRCLFWLFCPLIYASRPIKGLNTPGFVTRRSIKTGELLHTVLFIQPPHNLYLARAAGQIKYDCGGVVKRDAEKAEPRLSSCMTSLNGWLHSALDKCLFWQDIRVLPITDEDALEKGTLDQLLPSQRLGASQPPDSN
jgi:hypothetical protein